MSANLFLLPFPKQETPVVIKRLLDFFAHSCGDIKKQFDHVCLDRVNFCRLLYRQFCASKCLECLIYTGQLGLNKSSR